MPCKDERAMNMKRTICALCLACTCGGWSLAQDGPSVRPSSDVYTDPVLRHRPPESPVSPKLGIDENVDLTIPEGTALQVVIDRELRVQAVGQAVHGHIVEPVYAFDKLLIPMGTEVKGQISRIDKVPAGARTLAALDANLTPPRKIEIEFTELSLADGKHIAIQTSVLSGSGQVLQFVTAAETQKRKSVKDAVAQREKQAKDEARRQFDAAMHQVKDPGKIHRLERLAIAQLPVHPQYVAAGTVYFAELRKPLEFGSEPLTHEIATSINTDVPPGSMVYARLMTPLNSATTQKGAEVKAILSQPLIDGGKLVLPQGSYLKGTVVQVQPARHWKHNGQLRFVFRDLVLPNGLESKVEAMVQGVQSDATDRLSLDSEGGAETQTPKTRYLRTAISVGLAAATHENEAFNRAEGGAGGFKVVGIAIGVAAKSHALAIAMGAFGAGRSIYNNFIGRGKDVVFAKHTAMQIAVDTRGSAPERSSPENDAAGAASRRSSVP